MYHFQITPLFGQSESLLQRMDDMGSCFCYRVTTLRGVSKTDISRTSRTRSPDSILWSNQYTSDTVSQAALSCFSLLSSTKTTTNRHDNKRDAVCYFYVRCEWTFMNLINRHLLWIGILGVKTEREANNIKLSNNMSSFKTQNERLEKT